MKVLQKNYKTIIAFLIGIIVSASTAYLTTTKALTENGYAVDSSNVEYKDTTNNVITNVQAAIDGTCTKFNEQLNELRESMYPVGSIYLSTSLSTTSAVATALGGTWEVYGSGRTLIGSDGSSYKAGTTGGATSVSTTLTTSNLPAHTHTYDKSNATTGSTALTINQIPSHYHNISVANEGTGGSALSTAHILYRYSNVNSPYVGILSTNTIGGGQGHTHSISLTTTNTSSVGSGTAFTTSTMQPYIVVYMYRRTA